jgi:hypothetical protein
MSKKIAEFLPLLIVCFFGAMRVFQHMAYFKNWQISFYSDEAIYAMLSERFLSGDFLNAFNPYWNPGFPLMTIPFYLITHQWETAQILVSITANILLIFVLFFTLRKISIVWAIAASFIAAFSPTLNKLSFVWGTTESLYILILWLSVYFGWESIITKKIRNYILAGTFFGLAYFVRTDAVFTLIVFLTFLILEFIFQKGESFKLSFQKNKISIFGLLGGVAVYVYYLLSSSKLFTTTTINFYPSSSTLAGFEKGDFVGVIGQVSETENFTVNAKKVRNWTMKAKVKADEQEGKKEVKEAKKEGAKLFVGVAGTVASSSLSLNIKDKTYAVHLTSTTKILNKNWLKISLSQILSGDKVRVYGTASNTDIQAQVVRDISLPR